MEASMEKGVKKLIKLWKFNNFIEGFLYKTGFFMKHLFQNYQQKEWTEAS